MGIIFNEDEEVELVKTLNEIKETVNYIRLNMSIPKTVSVPDIAKLLGISERTLRDHPYLLPNNGESEFPTGYRRWTFETYLKWNRIPEEERRSNYSQMIWEKNSKGNHRNKK